MKVCIFEIDLRLFGLIFVLTLGYNFNSYCHAATIYSDRNTWETAAGGVSDVLEDFNEINIDMELPIDMSSFSLSTTGRTRARSIIDSDPYISPTDGKTNDYLVNGTTYFLATTTRETYTDESVVITFDNPIISWGVDLNPHSGDLSDGVIFATNSGESGTFYLPSTDSTEFRGFVAETQFTSVTFSFNPNSVGAFAEAGWDNLAAHYSVEDKNLAYTPVTPCRIVDTRNTSAGMIDAGTQRNFRVFGPVGSQGGNSSGCPSPLGQPLAAHINMVAVDPTGKGNLKAFPVGAGTGAGLSVNYNTIDTNLANAGTVKTVTGAGPDITVASNFSSTHVTIQVLGYYYEDGDFLYTPVKPCKIVDTRNTSAGMISANTQRDFYVFGVGGTIGAQGGNTAGCLQPLGAPLGGPEAAHINMVAVNPTGKGNLKAFLQGVGATTGLSVNYNTIDTNLANAGTVMSTAGAGTDITVTSNFSSAHVTLQVLGYYYPNGDLMYNPVTPCKIVDTRNTSAGIISPSTPRNFHVFGGGGTIGDQGGNAAGCPSPGGDPLAAHISMVAVNPTGKGNLKAFPVGAGSNAGLSINYNAIDTNLANAGTVKTVAGDGPDITVATQHQSAHLTIQVLGYYYAAP